jgi:hypothetical protein
LKTLKTITAILSLFIGSQSFSQELDKSVSVSLFTGMINYQGDLNPHSFTFKNSNFATGVIFRKPLNRWFTLRGGMLIGKIEAADRKNREYLQPRNLSFYTSLKEISLGLQFTMLDMSSTRFTPVMHGGVAFFHFNPWTYDNDGVKTFLKPLSTEGQGLSQYPEQRPYELTQMALAFGGGFKYVVNEGLIIGMEFNQRKTFTDYLDDVSTHFVDRDVLLAAKGQKAVDLAYRGDEVASGQPNYPLHGEQRGTPSEMDWYYFLGLTMEVKFHSLGSFFSSIRGNSGGYYQRCPRNVNY